MEGLVSLICNVTNPLVTLWYYYLIDKPCYCFSQKKKTIHTLANQNLTQKSTFHQSFFSFLQNLLQKYSHMFSLLAKQKGLLPITPYEPHKKQNTTHPCFQNHPRIQNKIKKYIFSLNNHILIKCTYGFVDCLTYSQKNLELHMLLQHCWFFFIDFVDSKLK